MNTQLLIVTKYKSFQVFCRGIRENCWKCNVYTKHNYVHRRVQGTFIGCLKSAGYRPGTEAATTDDRRVYISLRLSKHWSLSAMHLCAAYVSCSRTTQLDSLANYSAAMGRAIIQLFLMQLCFLPKGFNASLVSRNAGIRSFNEIKWPLRLNVSSEL